MKINAIDLLLTDKKIKFGENQEAPESATNTVAPEAEKPESGLNALTFQGMNNLVSTPNLAAKVGMMQEVATEEKQEGEAKEFVTPYQSNIAFQGRLGGKVKGYAMAALVALSSLGAASTLTSCEKDHYIHEVDTPEINITTNVYVYNKDEGKWEQLYNLLLQMMEQQNNQNKELQSQMATMLKFMQQMMTMMEQQGNDSKAFYEQMFNFMTQSLENQKIIIGMLSTNGMNQEEALKLIQKLIEEVQSGKKSAAEAMKELLDLVGDIKGLLTKVVSSLEKAEADRAELIKLAKEGNANSSELVSLTKALLESNNAANDKLDAIKLSIEKGNLDMNKNFDQIKNILIKLGYTQAQIAKMTTAQILAAIKENTQATKDNNALLQKIIEELQSGQITAQEAADKIIKLLSDIKASLNEIAGNIKNHYNGDKNVENYLKLILAQLQSQTEHQNSTNAILYKLYDLVEKNGKDADAMGKQILNYIAAVGFEMNRNFSAVLDAIKTGNKGTDELRSLLEKVLKNQDKNTAAIIEAMGNIKVEGGNIDLSSLEKMMAELLEQAKKNGNILSSIDAKTDVLNATTKSILDALEKEFGKNDNRYKNIMNMLTVIANKAGSMDDKQLLDKLDQILAKLDEIKDAIKDHKITVDVTGKVTCNCNCGKNHEGIIDDIKGILG